MTEYQAMERISASLEDGRIAFAVLRAEDAFVVANTHADVAKLLEHFPKERVIEKGDSVDVHGSVCGVEQVTDTDAFLLWQFVAPNANNSIKTEEETIGEFHKLLDKKWPEYLRRQSHEAFPRVGEYAYIDGRDKHAIPPLTLNKIFLRAGVSKPRIVWTLKHGDHVKILDRANDSNGKTFYLVRKGMFVVGWVGAQFLSKEKHEPIGDLWEG